jgi:hypothetical protein
VRRAIDVGFSGEGEHGVDAAGKPNARLVGLPPAL